MAGNPHPKKPFVKGDPRINRKGRPRSFDALRELARTIADEKATERGADDERKTIVIDGHSVTIVEAILRKWATSNNPTLVKAFIEIAYGKTPQPLELTGEIGTVQMTIEEWRTNAKKRLGEVELSLENYDDTVDNE